ncbi:hypothetical protein TVAG_393900 [Trichomonas vaginalis G3]|uniref:Uncharacterized protein n=1 Tax=Trichomonas vaginalis (strain ATCC PRA-98 / G3) TaxID=412133 RepID=A2DWA7_TRIV3|nr:hypothetical protein TVAGG3_0279500 [Trichomonas vaginalis G3]EAY15247.1 hypothetical protein TVAG_393900 [Trichomonas vaginalis G3]KAI5526449.1 hypothetical protein TVAGG3_0279500 [Trichomonas vaginalis G3]|eukprot:XP_001327470.1 hypothetical protein [Trichomonas vaginalis G3]
MFLASLVAIRFAGHYIGSFIDMDENETRFEAVFTDNGHKSIGTIQSTYYSNYLPKKVMLEKVSDFDDYDLSFETDGTYKKIAKLEFNLTGKDEYICSSLTDDMSHDVNGLISPKSIEFLVLRHDDQLWFKYDLRQKPSMFSNPIVKVVIGVIIYMIIGIALIFKFSRKSKKVSKKEY